MLFGLLPIPIFIGEVLSVFSLPGCGLGLGSLYSLVGLCPFGNKFLIIQKKEPPDKQHLNQEKTAHISGTSHTKLKKHKREG